MDAKTYIAKAVKILTEIDSLNEQLKEYKDEAKESGVNVAVASAIAKSIVSGKVSELKEKSQETIDLIDDVV